MRHSSVTIADRPGKAARAGYLGELATQSLTAQIDEPGWGILGATALRSQSRRHALSVF
jgi:hypothetical protein